MSIIPEWGTIALGLAIFAARIVDVSIGTIRTISTVYGRTTLAFCLGFFEVGLWLMVVSAVIPRVVAEPLLGVFYCLGFSCGNVVGIKLERRLAMGHMVVRIITRVAGQEMAQRLRQDGFGVTTFQGEGRNGPVLALNVVCRRRDMGRVITRATEVDPQAFYITEQAGSVSSIYRPIMQPVTGWRSWLKKK